jgi:hypothetical protein
MAELLGDERCARFISSAAARRSASMPWCWLHAPAIATCTSTASTAPTETTSTTPIPKSATTTDRIIDALSAIEKFRTTGWMVQQVNEFQDLVPQLVGDGCVITVAGDGLLQTVAQAMMGNIPLTPAQQPPREVLKRLNGASHPRGAEIGVFAGDMSAALLKANPILHLDMIDSWEGDGQAYRGDSGDWHAKLAQSTQDSYQEAARARTAFADDRRSIIRARSTEAPVSGEYDFVFLDADHSYEGCKADIAAWAPRIKPGGWLGGHDYANAAFPKFGVTQAVDEFIAAHGLKLELGENYTWFAKREHSWI